MGRLIDADALIELAKHKRNLLLGIGGNEYSMKAFDYVIKLIENQPTAYDVEKVVAELEHQKEVSEKDADYWKKHDWKDNRIYDNFYLSDEKANCFDLAIDIVKKGGC